MKKLIVIVIAIAVAALVFVQERKIASSHAEANALRAELASTQSKLQQATDAAKTDPKESERLSQERAELAKLRGEVSALRKEKAEWQKKRGAKTAALAAAQPAAPEPAPPTPASQAMQWVETVLNGPSVTKGVESGNARRKAINGEPLTEAEQALLLNMGSKSAEIEKSPDEFSTFQSAYISSLLNWNNDARAEQVKNVLTAAATAANSRGFDYHAPGQNADNWNEDQKALNTRATGAIQNLLSPEERAVFDKALIGVLGVDTGVGTPK